MRFAVEIEANLVTEYADGIDHQHRSYRRQQVDAVVAVEGIPADPEQGIDSVRAVTGVDFVARETDEEVSIRFLNDFVISNIHATIVRGSAMEAAAAKLKSDKAEEVKAGCNLV